MASIIDRNTKNLMSAKLQKELAALFAEQESSKRPRYNMRPLKAGEGDTVPPEDYRARQGNPLVGIDYLYGADNTGGAPWNFMNMNIPAGKTSSAPGVGQPFNAQGFGNNLMSIAPVISNLIGGMGKSQQLNSRDYYNPRRNEVASLMRNRRTNVQPQLDAVLNSERTGQYNLRNSAGSRGELMGNITALQNNAMRNRSAIYANKQNADLGYQGQEAEMLNSLGAGEQQANWNTMDYNNQNIANKRNIFRAGLSQLSQYSQNKELMKNQQQRDSQLGGVYKDMFGSIMPFMKNMQGIFDSLNIQQNG
jgi:hypothetical protein